MNVKARKGGPPSAGLPTMTASRAKLDRNRPFGTVYGEAQHRYEQDDRYFDHQGLEVDDRGNPVFLAQDTAAKYTRHASTKRGAGTPEKLSATAERVRRLRERRRQGIVCVVNVPVAEKAICALIRRGNLPAGRARDRDAIAAAVAKALGAWVES